MKPKLLIITDSTTLASRQAERLAQTNIEVSLLNITHAKNMISITDLNVYDLILINLFEGNGASLGLCQELRTRFANPIFLLSHRRTKQFLLEAYEVGADVCMLHPIPSDILVAKVHAWLRRTRIKDTNPAMIEAWGFRFEPASGEVKTPQDNLVHLSPQEAKLLHVLMTNNGNPVPRELIAEEVWPDDAKVGWDEGRLQVLVHRLRHKLGSQYIHSGCHCGYRFGPPHLLQQDVDAAQ